MTSISAISNARIALTILQSSQTSSSAPASSRAPGIDPKSSSRLSPGASGTIMSMQASASIPAEHKAMIARLGADSATVRDIKQLEGQDFEQVILKSLKESYDNDPAFQQALKDGTLQIQRAVDVPESGFRTYIYDLSSGGNHIGGAGATTANQAWFNEQQGKGGGFNYGTVDGQDFIARW